MNVYDLKKQIAELKLQVASIQDECSHPSACVTSVNKANTGNYDPSCNAYWTEHDCGLCGKHWSTDQ